MRVLVIDDESAFRNIVRIALEEVGIDGLIVESAAEALSLLRRKKREDFDLILLDIEMPGMDGWECLGSIREIDSRIPVVFLTSHAEEAAQIKGMREGVDDYLVKPIRYDLLIERLDRLRRTHERARPIRVGELELDPQRRVAVVIDRRLELSPTEFEVLLLLVREHPGPVSHALILERVWGLAYDPGTNRVAVCINSLRRKLGAQGPDWIRTVRGKGYRFAAGERGNQPLPD